MKLDEIFKLLDAGYTKEEIQAFEEKETPKAEEPEAEPADDKTVPEEEEKTQSKEEANDPVQEQIAKLTAAMERMSGMIISHNINGTIAEPSERSIDDMLAEVINPPRKERKEK